MTNTYLFAVWAGGGNVPPQLTLARRLAARGHRVRMLAPAVLRERVEAAGLVFEPYRHTPEHDESDPARSLVRDFAHRSPVAAAKAVRDHLLLDMAAPIAADVLAVLDNHRVDAVATDYTLLGALFAAEKAEVPAAALVHHTYPYPAPGLPPFGMGWQPRALPYADAVVTHAGHGTVIAALAHGLPLVCLPMGRDQHDNAARVAWHGAGLRLSCRSSPARIAAAVRTVLDNAAYREAAQRIAKAIIDERPSRAGPDELEDLAATRTS